MSLSALLDAVKGKETPEKRPFQPQLPQASDYVPNPDLRDEDIFEVPPFPLDVLPKRLRNIVEDCHTYLSYPRDFTASGILSAASMAIGRTYKARYLWEETACMYMALVAAPGTAKTHPLQFALYPIIEANKQAIKEYNRQKKALEAAQSSIVPLDKQCLFADFTIESMIKAIMINKRGVSVYMDELRGFFANFGRYNSGSEQEFWLQNWSGSPYAVTRMNRKYFLEWPAVSIAGTIQPSVLDEIGKGGRSGNGFVERILFCFPEKVEIAEIKKRSQRSDTMFILQKNYKPIIQYLLDKDLLLKGNDEEDDDTPHMLVFSPEADDLITDYINYLKKQMEKIDDEFLRNIYSKIQTYSIRFAMILNRLRYACDYQDNRQLPPKDDETISVYDVEMAMHLSDYFLKNAQKASLIINGQNPVDKLPTNLKKFYKLLPRGVELSTKELEEAAVKADISRATLFRLLNNPDTQQRIFSKIRHGVYERLY